MLKKFNHIPGGPVLGLMVLALALMGLGLAGCSGDSPTQAPAGGNDSATGVFHVDMGDDPADFEIISTKNGDPENPIHGPFASRGRNIRYDTELNALVMALSVKNLGDDTFDEPVVLTFLSLLPAGVTVLNPDNDENGPGAAIEFQFENDDNQWTPGEESFGREVQFGVDQGVSIGFVARLDMGGDDDGLGSIGGMVWNDENGDGIMDETESGVPGAMIELSAEGMDAMTMMSGDDGTYLFDGLPAGFYSVLIKPIEGMTGTTSPMIYVVLITEDGMVASFLAANFGVMTSAGTAVIEGLVWNDLNGDGIVDDGESGLEGVTVDLSGDATATTMTLADGTYAFDGLSMGSYEVASVGPDGWVLTTSSPIQVVLESDDAVFSEASFGWMEEVVSGSAIIQGMVWNDLNGDGLVDDEEPGLEGVTVNLTGDATVTTTTLADGTYAFEQLFAGTYEVASVGPDGWILTTDSPIQVVLATDDEVFDGADFGWMEEIVIELGTISGVVFDDMNSNQVQDDGEPGLEGIMVGLQGDAIASTTTDADGAYMFTDLEVGDYTVKSFGPAGWAPTTDDMVAVMIETAGQVVEDINFGWMAIPRP